MWISRFYSLRIEFHDALYMCPLSYILRFIYQRLMIILTVVLQCTNLGVQYTCSFFSQVISRADHHEKDVHLLSADGDYTALNWNDQVRIRIIRMAHSFTALSHSYILFPKYVHV